MKKGDLIRNKNDGEYAIIIRDPFVKFFPDFTDHRDIESGVADTAISIRWIKGGYETTFQKSKMKKNWELISESR